MGDEDSETVAAEVPLEEEYEVTPEQRRRASDWALWVIVLLVLMLLAGMVYFWLWLDFVERTDCLDAGGSYAEHGCVVPQ